MKLLFTDLDGTLLNSKKELSQELQMGLQTMLDNGHVLVLASGRPLHSILQIQENLGLTSDRLYISAYNGSILYHCSSKQYLLNETVALQDALRIIDLSLAHHIHIQTYKGAAIVTPMDSVELAYYTRSVQLETIICNPINDVITDNVPKLIAISLTDHKKLLTLKELIRSEIGDSVETVFSNPNYLEIFSANAGKGKSVTFLRDYLKLSALDTYAVGDAQNDLSMLLAAGTGCAMANATDEVKSYANHILSSTNDEDGVLELLNHFGFLSLNN